MDRVEATGAHAIGTGLGLAEPVERGLGRRTPPLDIDGYERLLDRPLWGKRELWIKGYRTYAYDENLFEDTSYHPGGELAPPEFDRELPHKIIAEAHARGMEAYVPASPTSVPNLRPEDQPHYPNGSLPDPERRVARQGCLNNPDVRQYGIGVVRDIVRHFPEADGLRLDWVEYTVYDLRDHFACTCPHCATEAQKKGYNWDQIMKDVRALWGRFHELTPHDLERAQRLAKRPWEVLGLLQGYPGWFDFLRFKAETVQEAHRDLRQAMDKEGATEMKLDADGWMPPFNRSSGAHFGKLSEICDVVRPKMHTFHWAVIPRWYGEILKDWNPNLSEQHILDTIIAFLYLPDDLAPGSFAKYHIPAPDEKHPAKPESWRVKLDEVVDQVSGRSKCYAYAHSYRPEAQWKRMLAVVRDSRVDGMWIQRYGYLSDSKLEVLGDMWA